MRSAISATTPKSWDDETGCRCRKLALKFLQQMQDLLLRSRPAPSSARPRSAGAGSSPAPSRSSPAGAGRRRSGAIGVIGRFGSRGICTSPRISSTPPCALCSQRGCRRSTSSICQPTVFLRVQRRHRFLKDHRQAVAAQACISASGPADDIGAVQQDASGGDADMRFGQQTHHRIGRQRLARAGFAHETDDLAGFTTRSKCSKRMGPVEPLGSEMRRSSICRMGSRSFLLPRVQGASFRPSPIRLKDRTVSRIATPGMTVQYQSERSTARPWPIMLPQLA